MAGKSAAVRIEFFGRDKSLGKTFQAQWKKADTFSKKIDLVGKRMRSVGSSMTSFVTIPIVTGFALATKAAMDDERSQRALAQQIRNTVEATDAQIASVEKFIDTQARATGVADDELRPAFAKLVTATGDLGKAQELLAVAQDTAAGTGRGLDSVITAMMKGTQGQVDLFGRMGIATRDASGEMLTFDEVVANLKKKFDGLAETKADPYARIRVAFGELAEAAGMMLVPALQGITDVLLRVINWFGDLSDSSKKVVLVLAGTAAAIGPLLFALGSMIKTIRTLTTAYRFLFVAKVKDGVVTRASTVSLVAHRVATMASAASQWLWNTAILGSVKALAALAVHMARQLTYTAMGIGLMLKDAAAWVARTAAMVAHKVALIATSAATKAAAAAQWLWNAALTANPIGVVVVAIAAFIAAVVILYKKNETFRNIVNKVWSAARTVILAVIKVIVARLQFWWGVMKKVADAGRKVGSAIASAFGWIIDKAKTVASWLGRVKDELISGWGTGAIDAVRSAIDRLLAPLRTAWDLLQKILNNSGGAPSRKRASGVSGRASGGPVSGGTPYLVGEVGPELFVPRTSGTIIPNNRLALAGGGSTTVNINVVVPAGTTIVGTAERVGEVLAPHIERALGIRANRKGRRR